MPFSDLVGLAGVFIVLISYLLLQLSVIKIEDYSYSAANVLGSMLILYSLFFDWNFSAAMIEFCWIFISLYGIFNTWRARKKAKKNSYVNNQSDTAS